jgi:hypothetical protein
MISVYSNTMRICNAYSVDATDEPVLGPRLGRLVNHGDNEGERNARMVVLDNTKESVLCLFATRDIAAGEQILYDYGVPVPWMRKVLI